MNRLAPLGAGIALAAMTALPFAALADTVGTDFESFTLGSVNGQQGWSSTGNYDQAVVTNPGISGFGTKSLRISDAVTSGSFGDQTFSSSLANEAGEAVAENGGFSGGTRQPHFEAQFDIASMLPTLQSGMHVSVSPDRGDGARMSYLRFEDQADGIHVFFDDVTDPTHALNADTFNETDIATISRAPHTVKLTMDFVAGPDNDVVKVYIDGTLVHTGTSWEDYYRFDSESNPSAPSDTSRTVDSLLFRESGTADPANAGNGFLFDNISLMSGPTPVTPPATPSTKDECMNGGWKTFTSPTFKNQGECVSFTNHNDGKGKDDTHAH